MITYLATLLLGAGADTVPTQVPDPPPQAPPGIDYLAGQIVGWLKWGVLVVGVAGILVCAGAIIIGRRHRGGLAQEGLVGSLWVLGGLTMAALAAVLAGAFAGLGAQ